MGFERGLSTIPTGKRVFIDANIFLYEIFDHPKFDIAKANMLLTHDALHIAVMKYESISDIASNDNDFERIEGITIWKP